jgi:hypothetical protein
MVCNVRIWKQEPCVLSVRDTFVILQQQFYEISIYNYMDQSITYYNLREGQMKGRHVMKSVTDSDFGMP